MAVEHLPDTPLSMIVALHVGRICGLLSIPLHLFVIGAIVRFRKTDPALNNNYFHMLANLCTIDLRNSINSIENMVYSFEAWRTTNDTVLPRFDAFCQYFAYQANLFELTAIAVNRLIEMAWPLSAKSIWTSNITILVNVGSWLCGVAFAIPLLSSVHKMEHLAYFQGIFWSNDWDNQTLEDAHTSKAYMDGVSMGGLVLSGLLLLLYVITFIVMLKHRSTHRNISYQEKKKYKAEVNLSIQALMLTSFVFMYNVGLILYTRQCCPWFVAPNIGAMLWAAHYSGPMFALCMSSVLRRNVRKLLNMRGDPVPIKGMRHTNRTWRGSKVAHSNTAGRNMRGGNEIELHKMAGPSNRVQHRY